MRDPDRPVTIDYEGRHAERETSIGKTIFWVVLTILLIALPVLWAIDAFIPVLDY